MAQALDYSAGFPGASNIKAVKDDKGKQRFFGAVRYIGRSGNRKNATAEELRDFLNNDIGMALVFEASATNWRAGFAGGQKDGRAGRDHANAIGFSAARPIYMAIDQDVVSSGEFGMMIDYLRGAGTSLGGAALTGVYGEADVIDRARNAGVATWYWQTAAWSGGRRTPAHLYQQIGTVIVGGIACDVNDILTADWGQQGGGMGAVEDLQAKQVKGPDGNTRGALDALLQGTVWAAEAIHAANAAASKVDALATIIGQLSTDPDVTPDQVKQIVETAFANQPPVHVQVNFESLSDTDLQRFAEAVNNESDRRWREGHGITPPV